MLNLPRLSKNDKWQLTLCGTGPYIVTQGFSILTGAREAELYNPRLLGQTGDEANYFLLASALPTVKPAPHA